MISALKEKLEEPDTSNKISQAMISWVKWWLCATHGVNPNVFSLAVQRAFRDQTRIGWCNLAMGFPVSKWAVLQQEECKRRGKSQSGKWWLTMKRLMETAWDAWVS